VFLQQNSSSHSNSNPKNKKKLKIHKILKSSSSTQAQKINLQHLQTHLQTSPYNHLQPQT